MNTEEIGPSLLAAFARVPDVRSRHGRRSPLPAVLTLATAAMLAGARSLYAIAQWGRLQPVEVRRALGFPEQGGTQGQAGMPAITTLHDVFKRLDVVAFEAVLQAWAAQTLDPDEEQLVLDGKALRGIHGEELPGVRLVSLYAAKAGLALAQAGGQDQRGAGTDMTRFPNAKHLASWAGVCPGNRRSAGKQHSGATTKGDTHLKAILCELAATCARCPGTYPHALYHRLARRRGKPRAMLAVAHSLLVSIYHMLRDHVPYHDLGADYFDHLQAQRLEHHFVRRLEALGFQVQLTPAS